MKSILFVCASCLLSAFTCSQKEQNSFEKNVLNKLLGEYNIHKKQHPTKNNYNNIRSGIFYSDDFLYGNEYILESKSSAFNKIKNYFHFSIYYYQNVNAPLNIMQRVDSLKKAGLNEGRYFPLGKEYHIFIPADKNIIHFVAFCNLSDDDWKKVKSDLLSYVRRNFRSVGDVFDKRCGH